MTEPASLPRLILERIEAAVAAGAVPQIVLDLDGTLFDNVPRTKAILLDSVRAVLGADHPLGRRLAEMPEDEFEYAPVDTLRNQGLGDEDTLVTLREEWASRFFGNGFLGHDRPLAGAVSAVRSWWERGAELNYLTGRHAPEMLPGTAGALADAGFPLHTDRAHLHLKPDFDQDDAEFKARMAPALRRKGPVILVVDNDPRIINRLATALPEALAVMVRTLHPKDAPAPADRVSLVRDFRDLA